jgi:hypothetical protein
MLRRLHEPPRGRPQCALFPTRSFTRGAGLRWPKGCAVVLSVFLQREEAYRLFLDEAIKGIALRIEQTGRLGIGATLQNHHAVEARGPAIELIKVVPPGPLRSRRRDIPYSAHLRTPQYHNNRRFPQAGLSFAAWLRAKGKINVNRSTVTLNKNATKGANPRRAFLATVTP